MAHLLDDRDLNGDTRLDLLDATWATKHEGALHDARPLSGKHLAVVMAKPSLRTRVSFTVAIRDLGGDVVEVGAHNTKLGKGEEMEEWAGVLGRMVQGIVARVHAQAELEALAAHSGVPVINALSDRLHPCQGLADAFTAWEAARLAGQPDSASARAYYGRPHRWAYLGDGNNVAHSLLLTAADLGVVLTLACPPGHEPDATIVQAARAHHPAGADGIRVVHEAGSAVAGAELVYTDTWISMGQESTRDAATIRARFAPYRVDGAVMAAAAPGAIFMHCLPAQPGDEVTAQVLRGPASRVLDQAENRLWTSKTILAHHCFAP